MADVQPADSVLPPQTHSPPATPPPSHDELPPIFAGSTSPSFAVNPSAPSALARLTLTDKLLLAQVVHHLAESPPNWASVSNFMLSHPLIKNPSRLKSANDANLSLARIFGTRECERAWTALMRQYNLVAGDEEPLQAAAASQIKQRPKEAKGAQPRMDRKSQLSLAQILYAERMEELRDGIKKKEEEFKALIDRIDQIKSNALDTQLQQQADQEANTPKPSTSAPVPADQQQQQNPTTTTDLQTSSRTTRRRASQPDKPEESSTDHSTSNPHQEPPTDTTNRKDDGDQRDVEDVLGGTSTEHQPKTESVQPPEQEPAPAQNDDDDTKHGKSASPAPQDEPETEDINDDTAAQQPEKPSETRRSKRKRTDTDAEQTTTEHAAPDDDDDVADSQDVPPTPARDTKRTRSSTQTEDAAPPTRTPKSRPPITPRRSRRGGANKDADEASGEEDDEPGDESMDVTADEAATTKDDATPARSRSTAASAPRRSLRGRGSTQSREASVRTEGHDDDDNDTAAAADDSAEMSSSTLKADKDGDIDIVSSRRSSRRETTASRRASSSARHSVESSSTKEQREREREKRRKANEKVLLQIWTEVSAHTHGNLFQNVVKESDAPDYHTLIRHPTSLKLIKTQIKEGDIQTITQLRRAFNHLFANALMYNRPNSEVGRMAREMRDETEAILDRFEETRRLASRR